MVYVENPLTGYAIKKGGPTYKQLILSGMDVEAFRSVRKGYRSPNSIYRRSMSPVIRGARRGRRRSDRRSMGPVIRSNRRSDRRSMGPVIRSNRRGRRRSMSPRGKPEYTKRGKKIGRLPAISKVMDLKNSEPRPLKETLADVPKSRRAVRRDLKTQISRRKEGRGSRTRGWKAAAPQKGRERQALMEKCGEGCFLQPDTKGFPICAALREGQGCSIDCRGVTSALVRANQWGYSDVAGLARKIQRERCRCRGSIMAPRK